MKYLYQLKDEAKQEVLAECFNAFHLSFFEELQKACEYEFELCAQNGADESDVVIFFDKSTLRLPREEIKKDPIPRLKDEKLHQQLCEYYPAFPIALHFALERAKSDGMNRFSMNLGSIGGYVFVGDCDGCVIGEEEPDATE